MNFIERFSGIFLVAGIFMFLLGVITLAVVPVWMVEKTGGTQEIATAVPENFQEEYPTLEEYKVALRKGRDIYISEGCWHCHSQFVRPTANESLRYGPVSLPGEYQNELNLPQLFGTRRVGPDLSRESGKRTNDWHYAHLYQPTSTVPQSVMPGYPWYFEEKEGQILPTQEAKALVAYLQWLGAGMVDRHEGVYDYEQSSLPPKE